MRRLSLVMCALALALSGCGMGKKQSPVGSDEELGRTRAQAEDFKPTTYVTRSGDTLASIAARSEIYGDSELWPLLLDANTDVLGQAGPRRRLDAGLTLDVPRVVGEDDKEEARERARQAAAAAKASRPAKRPEPEPTAVRPVEPAAPQAQAPAPPPPPQPAQPVPKAKKSGFGGLLSILLLVLAVLAGVLYYFSRRDKQDQA